ncbi:MAG: M48 family metallopeptidase [Patescibacteria group bacterium]|nr:M48 family metallopeptidase [Patescibacteria group bacterium]
MKTKDQAINYTLRRSRRARHLRLAVYCTGMVVVTAPWGFDLRRLEDFVRQKTSWIIEKLDFFKKHPQNSATQLPRKEYLAFKVQALALAKYKVDYWNQFYGFGYNRINIKNQSTRWGSCSKKLNLNFNYKIVKLDERLVDYLVVHELCHLKEFNHSEKFWALVAKTIPEYKICRKELKNHERI